MIVVFGWIEDARPRLAKAQAVLEESIVAHGLTPLRYTGGQDLFKFHDMLARGRAAATTDSFVWCNSDVTLRKNPFDLAGDGRVHGFHRTEVPSGSITYGVDMYLIPCRVWDELLSPNAPDLYCGASFVDWWITRACQKAAIYENHTGYIDHVTHEKSSAATAESDRYYRHNLREYNRWARRAGVGTVDVPVRLPKFLQWLTSWAS
ncbi:MAG: hypothetical protein Fur0032_01710 [Terrimicrobiaceae bacterium]